MLDNKGLVDMDKSDKDKDRDSDTDTDMDSKADSHINKGLQAKAADWLRHGQSA